MCRLFALRSHSRIRVDRAFTALQAQSHEHKDGWGVATFDGERFIERGLEPAHQSSRFSALAQETTTAHLMAHIRLASVGAVTAKNAHPFVQGNWVFMHNGTLYGFEKKRAAMEALIAPRFREGIRGETDTERCFGLFLTYLDGTTSPGIDDVARAVAKVMRTVAELFDGQGAEKPCAMNFLASNGEHLVASRRGRTLWSLEHPKELVVASEKLWDEPGWAEVPEDGLVGIDANLVVHRWNVGGLLAR